MAQSVLDEMEFLEISAGIKKSSSDDDDDFDYIYHLPTANPDQILYRDPFGKPTLKKDNSMSQLSRNSRHSIKAIRSMLDPKLGVATPSLRKKSVMGTSSLNSGDKSFKGGSKLSLSPSVDTKSILGPKDSIYSESVVDYNSLDLKDLVEDEEGNLIVVKTDKAPFRSLPDFVYRFLKANTVAGISLLFMLAMVIQVISTS
jgi:hypothetical protein